MKKYRLITKVSWGLTLVIFVALTVFLELGKAYLRNHTEITGISATPYSKVYAPLIIAFLVVLIVALVFFFLDKTKIQNYFRERRIAHQSSTEKKEVRLSMTVEGRKPTFAEIWRLFYPINCFWIWFSFLGFVLIFPLSLYQLLVAKEDARLCWLLLVIGIIFFVAFLLLVLLAPWLNYLANRKGTDVPQLTLYERDFDLSMTSTANGITNNVTFHVTPDLLLSVREDKANWRFYFAYDNGKKAGILLPKEAFREHPEVIQVFETLKEGLRKQHDRH